MMADDDREAYLYRLLVAGYCVVVLDVYSSHRSCATLDHHTLAMRYSVTMLSLALAIRSYTHPWSWLRPNPHFLCTPCPYVECRSILPSSTRSVDPSIYLRPSVLYLINAAADQYICYQVIVLL